MTGSVDRGHVVLVPPAPPWRSYVPWLGVALTLHAALLWVCARWRGPEAPPDVPPLRVTIASVLPGPGGDAGTIGPPRPAEEPLAAAAAMLELPSAGVMERKPTTRKGARPDRGRPKSQTPALAEAVPAPGHQLEPDRMSGGDPEWQAGASSGASESGGGGGVRGGGGGGGGGHGGRAGLGDARAHCVRCPAPAYPPIARQRNWSGVVAVRLELAHDGTVRTARVERSSGYEVLDREAVEAARRSRFRVPAPGAEQQIVGTIEYRFELVP